MANTKDQILPRKLYQHFKGTVYVVLGFALDPVQSKEKVIISNCTPKSDEMLVVDVDTFFEMKGDTPKFQLVQG